MGLSSQLGWSVRMGVVVWILVGAALASCSTPERKPGQGDGGESSSDHGSSTDPTTPSSGADGETTAADGGGTSTDTTGGAGTSTDTMGGAGTSTGAEPTSTSDETASTGAETSGGEIGCGNGIVEEGEQCDDGDESATCNADCTAAGCGDGVVNITAGEGCDDAGPSAACDGDCTPVACGDLVVNALAGEACDAADLAGGTCEALGYGGGVLTCDAGCAYATDGCSPAVPVPTLGLSQVKRFDFSWPPAMGAEHYQLLESLGPGEPYVQLGGDVVGESVSLEVPLHFRSETSYVLRACNAAGCTDSAAVDVVGSLAQAVGYVKASNTGADDNLGWSVALSADGTTLAVGAPYEDSSAMGIGGNQANDDASGSGAVYVFVRDGLGTWSQQAYVKASNAEENDVFGYRVALSADGSTLAVSAIYEDGASTGVGGDQGTNGSLGAGAVYVFVRDGLGTWSQQAYVKASNTSATEFFGYGLALSGDGSTLAVGATAEDSAATGVDGNQADDSMFASGAVYVFVRDGLGTWSQQAYVKASNTGFEDYFGFSVGLSGDGDTLAVGAVEEDSAATGVGGNQADNLMSASGAVYVFVRDGLGTWSQQAYVKASNTGSIDRFGQALALSADGTTLAVGAIGEDSNATGIDGDQANDDGFETGAVYVFVRDGLGAWSQQAYVKASDAGLGNSFGSSVALGADGSVLVVGAEGEDGNAVGIEGPLVDAADNSGAAYVFVRDEAGAWSQRAYVKASNTTAQDFFGASVALSGDGSTLAAGARNEDSSATGVGGFQFSESASAAGAVYLY